MNEPQAIAEALRKLQAGDAAGALAAANAIVASAPFASRGYLVTGLALRMLERHDESRAALERACTIDPRDYAAAFELGVALELLGDAAAALPHLERAVALRPAFQPARQALGLNLRQAGRTCVSNGDFARAAELFADAAARLPGDEHLQTFIFQSELLLGHWDRGWAAYRRARGRPEHLPSLADLRGKDVTIAAEQGLGDILFFLRFAPALRAHARALHFAGTERLHSLLGRTGLFASLRAAFDPAADANVVLLTGDLPEVSRAASEPCPPSIRVAPDPARLAAWRTKLEAAGPQPWIGVTWRAGTPHEELAFGLHKTAPVAQLLAALKPAGGTIVALQRHPAEGELDTASRAFGDKVHEFSRINDDLEDALAVVSLLDRHVGVSNTNMHLAAAAGGTADVLVPFPPEWRWGLGDESPWFPGFRIHRQSAGGDWSQALASSRG